jgi:hypothetical protein
MQGELETARQRHQQALAARQEIGEAAQVLVSQYSLAALDLQEAWLGKRDFTPVAEALHGMVEAFHAKNMPEQEAAALLLSADAWLGAGELASASAAIAASRELSSQFEDISLRVQIGITEARIEARQGRAGPAIARLEALQGQIEGSAILGLELELELALGEAELGSQRRQQGRQRLEQLRQDATARGWILVADKAARLLDGE